ncbi:TetR/AcrR family transcriptional regulator [Microcella alkaliphila]|uniref:Putative TetR family transcriptional regulator n=1 Tax=Microcella alkaliphila TaxID=279828 RepID=A0A0U5BRC7_9MICO|nr:TetR/AcrR family transcriptional regulator [Microcella alkaliphila]BAU33467.1 putative TetR family transcriptional regulator [Microcella alkaliphila]
MASSRVSLDDRRHQLIEATIGEMRANGVQSITLRSVAKRAQASLATVHYCFENKEALIQAAVLRWLSNMVEYAAHIPAGQGFSATVNTFAEMFWADLERTPEDVLAQIELVLWAKRHEDSTAISSLIYTGYEDELADLFSASFSNEYPDKSLDAPRFVRLLLAIFDGCSLQFILQPELPVHRENFFHLVHNMIASAPQGR